MPSRKPSDSHLKLISNIERDADSFFSDSRNRLKSGDGDGTSNGMEARVAKLEADMGHALTTLGEIKVDVRGLRSDTHDEAKGLREQARGDFRLLFGAIIAVALGLAGMMARGFGWL